MTPLVGPIGRVISANAVEQAVVATLNEWIPAYLAEMERVEGYAAGSIVPPKGIVTSSEFDKWDGQQLPVYLVLNAGLVGKPVRRGDSTYEATWAVGVAPVVTDTNVGATRKLASAHAAAVRTALAQHKALKSPLHPTGFAKSVKWEGESYADLPFLRTRSLGSMRVIFAVGVQAVAVEQAGPRAPIPSSAGDPAHEPAPAPWPSVREVDIKPHLDPLIGAPT